MTPLAGFRHSFKGVEILQHHWFHKEPFDKKIKKGFLTLRKKYIFDVLFTGSLWNPKRLFYSVLAHTQNLKKYIYNNTSLFLRGLQKVSFPPQQKWFWHETLSWHSPIDPTQSELKVSVANELIAQYSYT